MTTIPFLMDSAIGHFASKLAFETDPSDVHADFGRNTPVVVYWQTPDRNESVIRFYDRLGANRSAKQRYTDHQLAHETR